jgi:hypothetical protein
MDPYITPDGVFRVEYSCFEMRMSHTVCNPCVTHVPSGRVVFNRFGTMEDGSASVDDQGRLVLDMREYPGSSPGWSVVFDPKDGSHFTR